MGKKTRSSSVFFFLEQVPLGETSKGQCYEFSFSEKLIFLSVRTSVIFAALIDFGFSFSSRGLARLNLPAAFHKDKLKCFIKTNTKNVHGSPNRKRQSTARKKSRVQRLRIHLDLADLVRSYNRTVSSCHPFQTY